jgi:hypothetical protein
MGGQTVTGLWTGQVASGPVGFDSTPAATQESKPAKAQSPGAAGGPIDAAAHFRTIGNQPAADGPVVLRK